MNPVRKRVLTADGSYSIYQSDIDEHFHSVHGAISESRHVFIKEGLVYKSEKNKNPRIVEVGLGTGLNFLLSLEEGIRREILLNYVAIEPFPLHEKHFPDQYSDIDLSEPVIDLFKEAYLQRKESLEIEGHRIVFRWESLENCQSLGQADLIYYDAFSPRSSPEMWTRAQLSKAVDALVEGGVLVTYCAKGSVRRIFQDLGCRAERLPGPPGKREMLRIIK